MSDLVHLKSVEELHSLLRMGKPKHELVTVLDHNDKRMRYKFGNLRLQNDLYAISMRNVRSGSIGYGRSSYDFDEGTLVFTKPGQITAPGNLDLTTVNREIAGWTICFHPDILYKSILDQKMELYSFFSYSVNEALHMSQSERASLNSVVEKIRLELDNKGDIHSQQIITSCIELILSYCNRYYDRQFSTRSKLNLSIITKFENLLREHFHSEKLNEIGIPSVNYCGKALNLSSHYLSDLLKKESGKNCSRAHTRICHQTSQI